MSTVDQRIMTSFVISFNPTRFGKIGGLFWNQICTYTTDYVQLINVTHLADNAQVIFHLANSAQAIFPLFALITYTSYILMMFHPLQSYNNASG